MNKVTIWAGGDIFAIVEVPFTAHMSVRSYLGQVMSDAEDVWGKGVTIKKVSECRYEIDVSACCAA